MSLCIQHVLRCHSECPTDTFEALLECHTPVTWFSSQFQGTYIHNNTHTHIQTHTLYFLSYDYEVTVGLTMGALDMDVALF